MVRYYGDFVMKILFASDICFSYMDFPGKGAGERAFSGVKELFDAADFSFVNLENIFGEKEEFTPIAKGGPNLISSYDFYEYVKALNPNGIGLANNHCGDFGEEPLLRTISFLRENGHKVIGAGRNIEDGYKPCIFEKDGVKVYIFAVCENEYGAATEEIYGGAGYRLGRVRDAIKSAKAEGALPIIFFHGGNERNPYPSPMKLEMYRNFVEMGAKAVIAMHTHCPQGYELYNGAPIVYSMGNFFFPSDDPVDLANPTWNVGYLTELDIDGNGVKMRAIPYKFDLEKVIPLDGTDEGKHLLGYLECISRPLSDEKKMRKLFDSWCMISGIGVTDQPWHVSHVSDFEPEHLDAFIKERVKNGRTSPYINVKNIFSCEAHNELLRNTFDMVYEGRCEEAMAGVEDILKLQRLEYK